MALVTDTHALNLTPGITPQVVVHCSVGDRGKRIYFNLYDGSIPFTIPSGCRITVHGSSIRGRNFGPYSCGSTSSSTSGSRIYFDLVSAMTYDEGPAMMEITITKNAEVVGSSNFILMVEQGTYKSGVIYDSDPSVYEAILTYIQRTVIPEGAVTIDKTLTLNGAAADAKATGDAIKDATDTVHGFEVRFQTLESDTANAVDEKVGELQSHIDELKADIDDKANNFNTTINSALSEASSTLRSEYDTFTDDVETAIEDHKSQTTREISELKSTVNETITTKVAELEDKIDDVETTVNETITNKVDALENEINNNLSGQINSLESDYTDFKEEVNTSLEELQSTVNTTIDGRIEAVSTSLGYTNDQLNEVLEEIYDARENAAGNEYTKVGDHIRDVFAQLDAKKIDSAYVTDDGYLCLTSNEEVVVDRLGPFTGGGGGGGTTPVSNTKFSCKNTSGFTSKSVIAGHECTISLTWSSIEEEEETGGGTLKIVVGGITKLSRNVNQGVVTVDVSPYLSTGSNTVAASITDALGNQRTIRFSITNLELYIESNFDSKVVYSDAIQFPYKPVGMGTKTVYFIVDGEEIGTYETSYSNRQLTYTIPKQAHGAHSLEVYYETTVEGELVRSDGVYFEILCAASGNPQKIVAISFNKETISQYDSVVIPFIVYNPLNYNTDITIRINGEPVSTLTVDRTEQSYTYRADTPGATNFSISTGDGENDVTKTIAFTVVASADIPEAETQGLELFLSSYGRSNSEQNPAHWRYEDVEAVFTDFNFNSDGWVNDEDGITVLRVSNNARVSIPFKIFGTDFQSTGKTIEIEFATRNILNYDAEILNCWSGGRGLLLTTQKATLKSQSSEISTQYKEDEHVRLSFVIENVNDNRLMFIYINGIASGVVQYGTNDNFKQIDPVNIVIGSNYCTTDIYNIRVYSSALSRNQIVDNWIADTQIGSLLLERFHHNDIYDDYGNIVIEKLPPDLPYMVLAAPELPQYKGDKKDGVSGYFVNPNDPSRSFSFEGAQADVQGTSSQYYPRKNYKIKFNGGFDMTESGEHVSKFAMNDDAVPTKTFTFKADVASSEGANNVELVRLYDEACPFKTSYQLANPKVRQGIDGFPMVMFYNDGITTTFIGKYNFNNDKGTEEVFGFTEGDESWEIKNNGSDLVNWKSDRIGEEWTEVVDGETIVHPADEWLQDFEGRYPDGNEDFTNLKALSSWIVSTDTEQATNKTLPAAVTYGDKTYTKDTAEYRLDKFRYELPDHMEVDAVCFYYLFTELFLMVDSRAKNAFPTFMGGSKWFSLPYDMDTAIGINNEGQLVFGYELEDIDYLESGALIYNGQDSVLWINLRKTYFEEIKTMYQTLRSTGAISYQKIEKMFEDHQNKWPENVFNDDAWFKYVDPFVNDGSAYLFMLQGSKAEQRKWWLYNRFRYIDSKYNAGDSLTDTITIRAYANSNVTITPYADIYPSIKYGSYLVSARGKRDQQTVLRRPSNLNLSDTECYIYSASQLKSVGDLSPFKVGMADFSSATKLQELKIGDPSPTYSNGNLTEFHVGNLILLKKLDLRNCTAFAQEVDVSGCVSIEELYFDNTSIPGVTLPNGGVLKTLHLPNTVTSVIIRNQPYLTDFVLDDCSNVETLVLENVGEGVDSQRLLSSIKRGARLRLINFNWEFESIEQVSEFYDYLDTFSGIDQNGRTTDKPQVQGTLYVPEITGELYRQITEQYPSIEVRYDSVRSYLYYYDFTGTELLHTEVILDGAFGTWDGRPAKAKDKGYSYRFCGWSTSVGHLVTNNTSAGDYYVDARKQSSASDRNIYAAYVRLTAYYTVEFYASDMATVLQTVQCEYNKAASYTNSTPVCDDKPSLVFDGWMPNPKRILGDTKCYPVFIPEREAPTSTNVSNAYGVVWHYTDQDPKLVRVGKASNFQDPVPASSLTENGSSPFDNIYPWSDMKMWNINEDILWDQDDPRFSEEDYNVLVYIPPFYYTAIKNETDHTWLWAISPTQQPGYCLHPGSGRYISRYAINTLNSDDYEIAATKPTGTHGSNAYRAFQYNIGRFPCNYVMCDLATFSAVQLLYTIEYADFGGRALAGTKNITVNYELYFNARNLKLSKYHTLSNHSVDTTTSHERWPYQYRWIMTPFVGSGYMYAAGLYGGLETLYVGLSNANYNPEILYNSGMIDDSTNPRYKKLSFSLPYTFGEYTICGFGYDENASWAFLPDDVLNQVLIGGYTNSVLYTNQSNTNQHPYVTKGVARSMGITSTFDIIADQASDSSYKNYSYGRLMWVPYKQY